jgi:UDP-galactopyranose mutase
VPRPENAELYRKHEALAEATEDVTFVGRLATHPWLRSNVSNSATGKSRSRGCMSTPGFAI